jgi:hypothetical protein
MNLTDGLDSPSKEVNDIDAILYRFALAIWHFDYLVRLVRDQLFAKQPDQPESRL